MRKIIIQLLQQEHSCHAKFESPVYMSKRFLSAFGDKASTIAASTLHKIKTERVESSVGADYLQSAEYDSKRFWVIDGGSYVTILMPDEY